jgi:FkbM family methyltransferase
MQSNGRWIGCDNLLRLWKTAEPEGLFVDVGANIGACTLSLMSVGAHVVAFEPLPSNLFYLYESLQLNERWRDRVVVWPAALGAQAGTERIFTERGNAGNSPLRFPTHAAGSQARTVHVITLDSALWPDSAKPPPRIALMKMDVQGFEAFALEGARRLLQARAIHAIQLEVATEWMRNVGRKPSEICAMLNDAGFTLYVHECAGQKAVVPNPLLSFAQCQSWDTRNMECDVVALRKGSTAPAV